MLTSTVGPNIVQYGHCLRYQCYQLNHTHLYALQVFLPSEYYYSNISNDKVVIIAQYCHGNGSSLACSKEYKRVWCREGMELKLPNHYGNITCPQAAHYCSHSNNTINIEDVPPSCELDVL